MGLCYKLIANNSSGFQELTFEYDKEANKVYPILCGEYDGKEIHIDFEQLDLQEVKELITYLESKINN